MQAQQRWMSVLDNHDSDKRIFAPVSTSQKESRGLKTMPVGRAGRAQSFRTVEIMERRKWCGSERIVKPVSYDL